VLSGGVIEQMWAAIFRMRGRCMRPVLLENITWPVSTSQDPHVSSRQSCSYCSVFPMAGALRNSTEVWNAVISSLDPCLSHSPWLCKLLCLGEGYCIFAKSCRNFLSTSIWVMLFQVSILLKS
jgi:hypothetical protein